jgi:rare lipoprotein A
MIEKKAGSVLLGVLLITAFSSCSTSPPRSQNKPVVNAPDAPNAPLARELPSRTGNPESYVVFGKRYYVMGTSEGYRRSGIASWYGPQFHGKRTSSGSPFDMHAITAAHKSLPIPTYARVTNLENGRSIVVRINDRGPFVDDRVIDLSYAAADKLDMLEQGTAPVEVVALPPYQYLPGFEPKPSTVEPIIASATDEPEVTPGSDIYLAPSAASRKMADDTYAKLQLLSLQNAQKVAYQAPAKPSMAAQSGTGDETLRSGNPETLQAAQQSESPAISDVTGHPASLQATSTAVSVSDFAPLYLQVGAFSLRRNAEQLQQRLAGQFSHAIQVDSSNDRLFKVWIGPLANTVTAGELKTQLVELGIHAHYVVLD